MNRLSSWSCKILLAPLVKRLFIKEVKGKGNIPKRNFILATNHQSHLDEVANGYVCVPRRFHFIGQTDSYQGLPKLLLRIIYFTAGVIPLNRKSKESKKAVVKKAVEVLKKGDIVIIYPEGTRTRTGKMGKGKWGVAKIFLKTGVPILPAAISGSFNLLPPGGELKIKRDIRINIGQPLYFKNELKTARKEHLSSSQKEELLERITTRLMEEIAYLKKEIE